MFLQGYSIKFLSEKTHNMNAEIIPWGWKYNDIDLVNGATFFDRHTAQITKPHSASFHVNWPMPIIIWSVLERNC